MRESLPIVEIENSGVQSAQVLIGGSAEVKHADETSLKTLTTGVLPYDCCSGFFPITDKGGLQ
jgi:hypothetical protein